MREKERGSQEKKRSGHMKVSGLITHTHRTWSICSDICSDISAGVGEETSCLSALTVLGGLSASHQLLHCELC